MTQPPGTPVMFQGTSTQPVKYNPPPLEILEAVTASMGMYFDALTPENAPQFVIDAAVGLKVAMERWAEEIRHPGGDRLVIGKTPIALDEVKYESNAPSAADLDAHVEEHGGNGDV